MSLGTGLEVLKSVECRLRYVNVYRGSRPGPARIRFVTIVYLLPARRRRSGAYFTYKTFIYHDSDTHTTIFKYIYIYIFIFC